MKTRTGFVSNSSSSSFIIGAGVITDMDWFKSQEKDLKDSWEYSLYNLGDLRSGEAQLDWSVNVKKNAFEDIQYLEVESFTYSTARTPDLVELPDETMILIYQGGASMDGDGYFYNEDSWDYDYDVDIDQFEVYEQEAFFLFGSDKVEGQSEFGAGRNG